MSKSSYNKDALFEKLLGAKPKEKEEIKNKKAPQELRGATDSKNVVNCKVGRPAKTQEDVKKYSYYLTKRHTESIKKLAINLDTDYSSIVRNAIEEYARKHKEW